MNSFSRFGIGVGILAVCGLWCLVGLAAFIGLAVSRDSVPGASIFDGPFVTLYLVWGSIFVGLISFAFLGFRRSRPRATMSSSDQPQQHIMSPEDGRAKTADERLAHLVKKPN